MFFLLLSYSSRLRSDLEQNRAQSRLLYFLSKTKFKMIGSSSKRSSTVFRMKEAGKSNCVRINFSFFMFYHGLFTWKGNIIVIMASRMFLSQYV